MDAVYENAYITLAFSAADDCLHPILSPKLPVHHVRLAGDLEHVYLRRMNDMNMKAYRQSMLLKQKDSWDFEDENEYAGPSRPAAYRRHFWNSTKRYSALARRGWAYQEAVLSHRILYVTSCQVAWKCKAGSFVESQVQPMINFGIRHEDISQIQRDHPASLFNHLAEWQDSVGAFPGLELTYAADKLVAFSGIAKRYASLLQDDYMAGIWKQSVTHLLLWTPVDAIYCSRPSSYRAPSWSWAAVDGYVNHPQDYRYVNISDETCIPDLVVTDYSVELASPDVYGATKSAELSVRGFCTDVRVFKRDGSDEVMFPRSPDGATEDLGGMGVCLDIAVEFGEVGLEFPDFDLYPPETYFTFLLVSSWKVQRRVDDDDRDAEEKRTWGLLLVEDESGRFSRVGTLRITDEILHREEWTQRDLVLI